ncbi:efflux RND transporter periplasmic adaptor subunit [Bowmanella denitrificans]|uniref:efflux RND transporter periplasmic adaptor subunit n=1 Tax=Bowmanella denitrificans TaxID=366582 RepID=UPI000C9AA677|nr:efflux RND transporter periplasmic adaptor subunit [Bowmanella denitrificans]
MSSRLKKVVLPIGIILLAGVVAAIMIFSRKPPAKVAHETQAFLVEVIQVSKRDVDFQVKSQGTVIPRTQTMLSSQVSGKIVELSADFIEGGLFNKGDVLIKLEQADHLTELKSAEAQLASAKAALQEEQARGKVAAEDWKTVKNSIAPELGLRKPQLQKEKANVLAAEAQLERAQRNLERTLIRAPYDGLVKSKTVDIGQFVGVGTQLGVIYGTDVAEVRLPLSDNDLAYLALPSHQDVSEVSLTSVVAGQPLSWEAKLVRSEGVLDPQSRVIYAVAEVSDPYLRKQEQHAAALKFGRFVSATIRGNHARDLVVLPRHVLRLDGTVLVVDQELKLQIRPVNIVRADERHVYIDNGLQEGEKVTVSAVPNPVNGMPVRLNSDKGSQAEDSTAPGGDGQ